MSRRAVDYVTRRLEDVRQRAKSEREAEENEHLAFWWGEIEDLAEQAIEKAKLVR
ncbi:hypothetical protein NN6n1_12710 [Shinella zoogloeoides]